MNTSNPLFAKEEYTVSVPSEETERLADDTRVLVLCSSKRTMADTVLSYNGLKSCALFVSLYDGAHDCRWGCVGFGDCAAVCPSGAIHIENGTAVIDDSCRRCGRCISACPRGIIKAVPAKTREFKLCAVPAAVNEQYDVGCSEQGKRSKLIINDKKLFQFWQKCYKILRGTKESR